MDKTFKSPKLMSAKKLSEQVSDIYPLKILEFPAFIDEGVENAVWKIVTDKGSFVVKVFALPESEIETIQEEVNLYQFLRKNGINAPFILASKRGFLVETLKTDSFSYPMIIMRLEFLKRVTPSTISLEELSKIASKIAYMHNILTYYPRKHKIKQDKKSHNISLDDFDIFLDSPNSKYFTSFEINEFFTLEKKILEKIKIYPSFALTESVLHRDLQLQHILFLPNNDIYFLDFSDFQVGPVIFDLAIMLVNLFKEENILKSRWRQLKKLFLATYVSEFGLDKEEINEIDYFMLTRILDEIRYLNAVSLKTGKEVDAKGIKRRYLLAKVLLPLK